MEKNQRLSAERHGDLQNEVEAPHMSVLEYHRRASVDVPYAPVRLFSELPPSRRGDIERKYAESREEIRKTSENKLHLCQEIGYHTVDLNLLAVVALLPLAEETSHLFDDEVLVEIDLYNMEQADALSMREFLATAAEEDIMEYLLDEVASHAFSSAPNSRRVSVASVGDEDDTQIFLWAADEHTRKMACVVYVLKTYYHQHKYLPVMEELRGRLAPGPLERLSRRFRAKFVSTMRRVSNWIPRLPSRKAIVEWNPREGVVAQQALVVYRKGYSVTLPRGPAGYIAGVKDMSIELGYATAYDERVDMLKVPRVWTHREGYINMFRFRLATYPRLLASYIDGDITLFEALTLALLNTLALMVAARPFVLLVAIVFAAFSVACLEIVTWMLTMLVLTKLYHGEVSPVVCGLTIVLETFSVMCGFPLGLFVFIGLFPAAGEERFKRMMGYHFGGLGVFAFGMGELFIYVQIFGPAVIPVRIVLVGVHMWWSTFTEQKGELAHMIHNSTCVAIILSGMEAAVMLFGMGLNPFVDQFRVLEGMHDSLGVIAVCCICIASTLLALLIGWCLEEDRRHPELEAQARKRTVRDYVVAGDRLFFKDGFERMRCSRFPPLFTFAEWEIARQEGLRDLMSRSQGWASPEVVKHYLLCIRFMQTRKCAFLDEALDLQMSCCPLQAQAGVSEVVESLTGGNALQLLKAHGKRGSIFLRVVTFAQQECRWPVWVSGFSREILELGLEQADLLTPEILERVHVKNFVAWLRGEEIVQPQSFGMDFFESPLYKTFMKVVQSIVFGTFLEEKLGFSAFTVKVMPTVGAFLADLYSLLHMARDAVVCFVTGRKSSIFCSSFSQTEGEVDALLKSPLPTVAEKDFVAKRAERLALLGGMSDALKTLSNGKPELTMRHLQICATIDELKRRMFSSQLGVEPVVFALFGPTAIGKSWTLGEINAMTLTLLKLCPEGSTPYQNTYILRFLGAKHLDAMPEPGKILSVIMDDFQQCTKDPTTAIAELSFLHANAACESVPLPFASIEGKAKSTDLQNQFLKLASNNEEEVLKGADMFNARSLYRRIGLYAFGEPVIPGAIYSAENPPGRFDVRFRFFYVEYVDNKTVPRKTPRVLEGVFETTDRVEFIRLVSRWEMRQRKFKDEMLAKRVDANVCPASGLNEGSHYGVKCGECCVFDLPFAEASKPAQMMYYRNEGGIAVLEVTSVSELVHMEGFWNADSKHYVLMWNRKGNKMEITVPSVVITQLPYALFARFHDEPVAQSASPMANQFAILGATVTAALFAPDSLRLVVVVVALIVCFVLVVRNTSAVIRWRVNAYVIGAEVIPELFHEALNLTKEELVLRRTAIREAGEKFCPTGSKMKQFIRGTLHLRVKERINSRTTVALAMVGAVCTAFAGYYMYKGSGKPEEAVAQVGNMPAEDNKKLPELAPSMRRNVTKTYYSGRKATGKYEDVLPHMVGATAQVSVGRMDTRDFKQFCVLTGNLAIMTKHGYTECMNFWPVVNTGDADKGQRVRFTHVSGPNGVYFVPGQDLAIVEFGETQKRDISNHFLPLEALRQVVGEAFMIVKGVEFPVTVKRRVTNYHFLGEILSEGFEYELPFDSYVGLCGSLIVCKSSTGCLFPLGIHHAGLPNDKRIGWGQYVSSEHLAHMTVPSVQGEKLDVDPVPQGWWPLEMFCSVVPQFPETRGGWKIGEPFELVETGDNVTTSYLPISAIRVGTLPGRQNRLTGSLRESILSPFFPEGGPLHFQPAAMKDEEFEEGKWRGPFATLGLATAKDLRVCSVAFRKACEDMKLSDSEVVKLMKDLTPLSVRQAVRGIAGLMNPMRLDTSAGFGRSGKSKSEFIRKDDDGGVTIEKTLWQEVVTLIEKPFGYELPVMSCFKVEIRPIAKMWSTRAFTIFPAAFLLVCRMFLSPIFALWRQFPISSETMIGQNAAGRAWSTLGEMLDSEDEHKWWFLNIDFKKYDKSFTVPLKSAAYNHILWLVSFTAYTAGQMSVCLALFAMLLNVFIFIHMDCFHIWDWNHSGDPFTVEVNSLGQRLLFRYWFFKCISEMEPGTFQKWIKLVTYGDDGLAKVRRDPRLSVLSFIEAMADWGMEATSAIKGSMAECGREQLTFLKRGVVYDLEFFGYRAPLDEASIYKMLCWFDSKSAITEGTWASAVCDNAAAEWFLHGRARFEVETQRLREACGKCNVVYQGRSWDEYMARYMDSTFVTWDL
jgi:hypothetical protein